MTKFQWILIGIFCVFIFVGILVFSMYKGGTGQSTTVAIWGTIPQTTFNEIISKTSLYNSKQYKIDYIQKTEDNFDGDFIEALASGGGPDLIMLPSDKILKHRNKLYAIPYNVFTQRQFKDSFIEGAEVYMAPEGVLALPIYADPLVMYWNRQIFTDAGITQPPKYWDEFYNLANIISKKDGALNVSRSLVSFGEFNNVAHAKEIVVNLATQAGTPVIVWSGNTAKSVFTDSFGKPTMPAEAAVNFYTEFSNPAKSSYSWNRSLPNSTNFFLAGNLALYFGFADEIKNLQLKNPNLNFDVAEVPASRDGGSGFSYAKFNALAVTKSSKNPNAAYTVASILSGADAAVQISQALNLPPARRDLLAQKQTDAYMSVFYDSTVKSKTWLDPDPAETDAIFKDMIESVTSGRARTSEAVSRAQQELSGLLK